MLVTPQHSFAKPSSPWDASPISPPKRTTVFWLPVIANNAKVSWSGIEQMQKKTNPKNKPPTPNKCKLQPKTANKKPKQKRSAGQTGKFHRHLEGSFSSTGLWQLEGHAWFRSKAHWCPEAGWFRREGTGRNDPKSIENRKRQAPSKRTLNMAKNAPSHRRKRRVQLGREDVPLPVNIESPLDFRESGMTSPET